MSVLTASGGVVFEETAEDGEGEEIFRAGGGLLGADDVGECGHA